MITNRLIRKAILSDAAQIFTLYKKVAVEDGGIARSEAEITEGYVQKNLDHSLAGGLCVVVEIDGQIVGELHAYPIALKYLNTF
jgi:hypothetical protein